MSSATDISGRPATQPASPDQLVFAMLLGPGGGSVLLPTDVPHRPDEDDRLPEGEDLRPSAVADPDPLPW